MADVYFQQVELLDISKKSFKHMVSFLLNGILKMILIDYKMTLLMPFNKIYLPSSV